MPAAIFDGHGGHLAADYMSQNLYKILSESINDELHNTEVQSEFSSLPKFATCAAVRQSVACLALHMTAIVSTALS